MSRPQPADPLVLAIRPEPGCAATVRAGQAAGLKITGCPLSEICPTPWHPPSPDSIDGILLGSANAVRHAGDGLAALRDKPVYAVGDATAAAAAAYGLRIAAVGPGMLQALLDGMSGADLRLLRLTGADHVPVTAPAGIEIDTRVAYENRLRPLPKAMAERLARGGLVLLHSAVAARHFANECDRLGVRRAAIRLAALGPRIAGGAGAGWQQVASAPEPREAALLALARDMCHERPTT